MQLMGNRCQPRGIAGASSREFLSDKSRCARSSDARPIHRYTGTTPRPGCKHAPSDARTIARHQDVASPPCVEGRTATGIQRSAARCVGVSTNNDNPGIIACRDRIQRSGAAYQGLWIVNDADIAALIEAPILGVVEV